MSDTLFSGLPPREGLTFCCDHQIITCSPHEIQQVHYGHIFSDQIPPREGLTFSGVIIRLSQDSPQQTQIGIDHSTCHD